MTKIMDFFVFVNDNNLLWNSNFNFELSYSSIHFQSRFWSVGGKPCMFNENTQIQKERRQTCDLLWGFSANQCFAEISIFYFKYTILLQLIDKWCLPLYKLKLVVKNKHICNQALDQIWTKVTLFCFNSTGLESSQHWNCRFNVLLFLQQLFSNIAILKCNIFSLRSELCWIRLSCCRTFADKDRVKWKNTVLPKDIWHLVYVKVWQVLKINKKICLINQPVDQSVSS